MDVGEKSGHSWVPATVPVFANPCCSSHCWSLLVISACQCPWNSAGITRSLKSFSVAEKNKFFYLCRLQLTLFIIQLYTDFRPNLSAVSCYAGQQTFLTWQSDQSCAITQSNGNSSPPTTYMHTSYWPTWSLAPCNVLDSYSSTINSISYVVFHDNVIGFALWFWPWGQSQLWSKWTKCPALGIWHMTGEATYCTSLNNVTVQCP